MKKTFPLFLLLAALAAHAAAQSGRRIMTPPPASVEPQAEAPSVESSPAVRPSSPSPAELTALPQSVLTRELQALDRGSFRLSDFGGRVLVVNLWATWCGPCRAEIPSLVELNKKYNEEGSGDVVILGISVDDPVEKLKPYAAQMKMNYPVLVGNGRDDVQDAFGPLWGIPVTVFIDREGRIAKKHSGIASKEQFEQEIKALL